jgi:hypothetical protein
LAEYINDNKHSIDSKESNIDIGNLLPSAYISNDGYNFKAFIDEYLLAMHNEAEKIIIYLAPIVFNINLDLYILEGTANLKENLSFFKQNFPCLIGENKLNNLSSTISLFYRFNHYDTFYTSQVLNEFNYYITFSIYDKSKIIDSTKQRITVLAEIPCDVCNRQTELLILSHIPGLSLCRLCSLDFVNKVILKRTKNYTNEFFYNKECK